MSDIRYYFVPRDLLVSLTVDDIDLIDPDTVTFAMLNADEPQPLHTARLFSSELDMSADTISIDLNKEDTVRIIKEGIDILAEMENTEPHTTNQKSAFDYLLNEAKDVPSREILDMARDEGYAEFYVLEDLGLTCVKIREEVFVTFTEHFDPEIYHL